MAQYLRGRSDIPNVSFRKGVRQMKKLAIALAIVLGLNLIGWTMSTTTKVSYAQESPQPEPQPEPKPEKPSE